MSDHTGIQWTDATWNPIRGCSRVSEGCRHCYAETVARRFSGPGMPYEGLTSAQGRWNGTIKVVDEHLTDPLRWKRPRRVFVNSMSDLFHEAVTDEVIDRIFAVMALAPRHTFQVLTKRPERMRDYLARLDSFGNGRRAAVIGCAWSMLGRPTLSKYRHEGITKRPWPLPNVWLGVSVEDQATADARIPLLLHTPAAVRFISAEPLLAPIDLKNVASAHDEMMLPLAGLTWSVKVPARLVGQHSRLDWVIVGGESGPGARHCHVAWVRSIVHACADAEVPCFVKQLGAVPSMREDDWREGPAVPLLCASKSFRVPAGYVPLALGDRKGSDMAEWPEGLRVRQFPEVRA